MTARQQIAATRPGQEWAAGNTMTGSGDTTVVRVQPPATLAGRLVQVGLALLIVAVSVPFFWKQTHTPIKADFRGATAYIVERARPDDLLIFVMPYVQRGFTYYHPQLVRTAEPPYTRDMSPAELDQAMRTITAGSTRVWLFLSEAEFWDPGGMITDWFEHNAVRRCGQQFSYIEVRCYDMVR